MLSLGTWMQRWRGWSVRWCVLCLAVFGGAVASASAGPVTVGDNDGLEHVRLQLKWRHQFQFAGFYAALEKGYYRDAGFDVSILPARPGVDAVREVEEGRAEYGVASSELVLHYARGVPVVVLGVIFQHSPLVLFARRASGIEHIGDLAGKRVAMSDAEVELTAYLRREGVSLKDLIRIQHDFSPQSLLLGRVDALAGYDTDESWFLREHAVDYIRFTPRAAGIDFYGDALFTGSLLAASAPERVAAFRDASLRGWSYALEHPDEIVRLIHRRYAPDLSPEKLRFEAEQMSSLVRSDMVELGYSHEGRWQHILGAYQEQGLLSPGPLPSLEGFLFRTPDRMDYRWLVWVVLVVLVILSVVSWIASRFHRLNGELLMQLSANRRLQAQLREEAIRDALTGLFNRRYLNETLTRELSRSQREHQPLSVVILDIDHFKQINDSLGHATGDDVLAAVAAVIQDGCRDSDIPCRYGGDELMVVMLNATPQASAATAERWRARLAGFQYHGQPLAISFSAGVAGYPRHAATLEALLKAADDALYQAKAQGRNRTVLSADTVSPSPP